MKLTFRPGNVAVRHNLCTIHQKVYETVRKNAYIRKMYNYARTGAMKN